jgi:hypothetical protein
VVSMAGSWHPRRPGVKGGDSSRDERSRRGFAVRRPGSPEAFPRSHGMPCRGFMLGGASARLVLTVSLKERAGTTSTGAIWPEAPRGTTETLHRPAIVVHPVRASRRYASARY